MFTLRLVTLSAVSWLLGALSVAPLHGAAFSTPVPHWVVLMLAVPALWLVVGVLVFAVDRALGAR